jgi:DUF1680 family protein
LNTIINSHSVSITEETAYPFENSIRFTIACKQPTAFTIKIRKPEWAVAVQSSLPYKEQNGFLVFQQVWNKENKLTISFSSKLIQKETADKEIYFVNGPLVLCHPIEAEQAITKTYNLTDLRESVYQPTQPAIYQYEQDQVQPSAPFNNSYSTQMLNLTTGKKEVIRLVPMAKTILRQVTFKLKP